MKSVFYLLLSFFISSCSTSKVVNAPLPSGCTTEAKVLDYTGLDGCRFLLELKDGTRLLPIALSDPEFLFSEGQVVKIDYKVEKEVVSACLTAALPSHINCIQEIKAGEKAGQLFTKRECIDTDAPLAHAWVKKMVMRNKVTEIKRAYKEAQAVYIMYGNVNVHVFNCYGEMICEYPKNDNKSSCEAKSKQYSNIESVWAQK